MRDGSVHMQLAAARLDFLPVGFEFARERVIGRDVEAVAQNSLSEYRIATRKREIEQ